jgi:hypothetical protein
MNYMWLMVQGDWKGCTVEGVGPFFGDEDETRARLGEGGGTWDAGHIAAQWTGSPRATHPCDLK